MSNPPPTPSQTMWRHVFETWFTPSVMGAILAAIVGGILWGFQLNANDTSFNVRISANEQRLEEVAKRFESQIAVDAEQNVVLARITAMLDEIQRRIDINRQDIKSNSSDIRDHYKTVPGGP